jgi:hypothetical protein
MTILQQSLHRQPPPQEQEESCWKNNVLGDRDYYPEFYTPYEDQSQSAGPNVVGVIFLAALISFAVIFGLGFFVALSLFG